MKFQLLSRKPAHLHSKIEVKNYFAELKAKMTACVILIKTHLYAKVMECAYW
jgi:hypothetical protein